MLLFDQSWSQNALLQERAQVLGILNLGRPVSAPGSVREISWIPYLQSLIILAILSMRTSDESSASRAERAMNPQS